MTQKALLEITNLHTLTREGEKILRGVDLQIKTGEVCALLGPNGCGKSTLAQTILGNSKYKINKGEIKFNGKVINEIPPEKRVKLGIALTHQHPPAIKGVSLSAFLKIIQKDDGVGNKPKVDKKLLSRDVNLDYSGGEKKVSELLQVLSLEPKLVILDELDSGLDIRNLKILIEIIKEELVSRKVAILIITHSGIILDLLRPNMTCVMVGGRIICRNKDYKTILKTIKKYGYEKCKRCPFLAN